MSSGVKAVVVVVAVVTTSIALSSSTSFSLPGWNQWSSTTQSTSANVGGCEFTFHGCGIDRHGNVCVANSEDCPFDEMASFCGNNPVPACFGLTWREVENVINGSFAMDDCIHGRLTTREKEKVANHTVDFADLPTAAAAGYDPNTATYITYIDIVEVERGSDTLFDLVSHEYAHHILYDAERRRPSGHSGVYWRKLDSVRARTRRCGP